MAVNCIPQRNLVVTIGAIEARGYFAVHVWIGPFKRAAVCLPEERHCSAVPQPIWAAARIGRDSRLSQRLAAAGALRGEVQGP